MTTKYRLAQGARLAFLLAFPIALLVGWSQENGSVEQVVVPGLVIGAIAFLALSIRCSKCGVSYYYSSGASSWGVDVTLPPPSSCAKCGFDRSTRPDGGVLF